MNEILFFIFAVSLTFSHLCFSKNETQVEDQVYKNILSHFYHKKGWELQTRKNIDLNFKIESVESKNYYSLGGNKRKLYRVQYKVSYQAKNECALFKFVPRELDAYVHDAMKIECYGESDKIKGGSHKSNQRSWELEHNYRQSRSIHLKAGNKSEDNNMTLYVAINDSLNGFKLAPKVHWDNYYKNMKKYAWK